MDPVIGINGFGRIGRIVARILFSRGINLTHVNDPAADAATVAYALRYDSIYGELPGQITTADDTVNVASETVRWRVTVTSSEDGTRLPWPCDVVVDATNLAQRADAWRRSRPAQRIIIAGRDTSADATIVVGAMENTRGRIWAASTCDAVALAPVISALHDQFRVASVFATILHPVLSYQRVLDLWPPLIAPTDLALARSSLSSIIPHVTSAATAIGEVIPVIADGINVASFRVPTDSVCIADLVVTTIDDISRSGVVEVLRRAPALIRMYADPVVSRDIVGSSCSAGIFESLLHLAAARSVRLTVAYDNEWGYASRVCDLAVRLSST